MLVVKAEPIQDEVHQVEEAEDIQAEPIKPSLSSLMNLLRPELKNMIMFYALACPHQPKRKAIYYFKSDICGDDYLYKLGKWRTLIIVKTLRISSWKYITNKELWEMLQANHIGKIPNKSKIKTKKQLIQALMAI